MYKLNLNLKPLQESADGSILSYKQIDSPIGEFDGKIITKDSPRDIFPDSRSEIESISSKGNKTPITRTPVDYKNSKTQGLPC